MRKKKIDALEAIVVAVFVIVVLIVVATIKG